MRRLLALFVLLIPFYSIEAMVRTGVEVRAVDYDDDDGQVQIWIGPGWYSGYWFDDEVEYHRWHHHHYRGRHYGGHHGGGHHGGHHGRHH
ncbi:MAG: hypothetical protein HW387_1215 [Parachlamydiales bacterium]|nr:hypothetical protein [Parachlamydiales bacterium]